MEDTVPGRKSSRVKALNRDCKDQPGASPAQVRAFTWKGRAGGQQGVGQREEGLAAQSSASLLRGCVTLGACGLWCENSNLSRILTVLFHRLGQAKG